MRNYINKVFSFLLISFTFLNVSFPQDYKIIKSDDTQLILEFNFEGQFKINDFLLDGIKFTNVSDKQIPLRNPGEPFLPSRFYEIGIPMNSDANVTVLEVEREVYNDKFIIATPDSAEQPLDKLNYAQDIYGSNASFPANSAEVNSQAIFRYIKTASLSVSPFQFNPVERTLIFNKKIKVKIDFQQDKKFTDLITPVSDKMTEDLIANNIINPQEALKFLGKVTEQNKPVSEKYWYDPNKDYYKIYLNEKGVYRITWDYLVNAGIPANALENMQFELFNDGKSLPIDIVDVNNDNLFNSGDYFQFVGTPIEPTPYAGQNIYNTTNVFWFSYQADSVNLYKTKSGYPTNTWPKIVSNQNTIHYEKDLRFDRLGYAPSNIERDYWFWDKAVFQGGHQTYIFNYDINHLDSNITVEQPQAKVRLNVLGLNLISCSTGHSAYIKFNNQKIGNFNFPGLTQNSFTYEKNFVFGFNDEFSPDSIYYRWGNNYIEVGIDSPSCLSTGDDYIYINWIEFDYWRNNRVNGKYYNFTSLPGSSGSQIYYLWNWYSDNMKVYIPDRAILINDTYITNDSNMGVYFVDTVTSRSEYFLVSNDLFLTPDSIKEDQNSNLRNLQNGADYIIISHKDFLPAAERLALFRSSNLQGIENPRVMVVDVNDVYDEFSFGHMDPFALKEFTKYAFENWDSTAVSYIVLIGDMSFDYRRIFLDSRPNFIPSVPFQSQLYGLAPSDNNIVSIIGNDYVPDLAIGRISCETLEEANILVDKIINYPADQDKEWKKNVLLLSSGLSAEDENNFKFNDKNMYLENNYLTPAGIKSSKVFRYPNKPEYMQYQGEGPAIRSEIDKGAVIVNYYGHGGGYQWDLVFTNDDILALDNGDKLPFVISVTCYTAHFDNQEIFGEIFNSIPGKGSIAFWGSSGVTFWPTTALINQVMFEKIFNNKKYVIGDAILLTKTNSQSGTMIPLLTLLGDPALELALPYTADFSLKPSFVTIDPSSPLVDDSVTVTVLVKNLGRSFGTDSVRINLYETQVSDTSMIGSCLLGNFSDKDSVSFIWVPKQEGMINLIAIANADHSVLETDFSDNSATKGFSVYSIDKPKILKPLNYSFLNKNNIDFIFVDVGQYVGQSLTYKIELDTTLSLNSSFKITSPLLYSKEGLIKWISPQLDKGEYFWRAYIFSDSDTNSSDVQSFTITEKSGSGYLTQSAQLKTYALNNILFSEDKDGLILNTELLPPRPSPRRLLDSIFTTMSDDSTKITTCTTDGKYLYYGDLTFYREGRNSHIYKVGTGFNGTIKGQNYGAIPNIEIPIKNQIFYHSDGFIYVATGDDSTLLQVNPETGDTSRVIIPSRLLTSEDGLLHNDGIYICSDGNFVYNLSPGHGFYRNRHVVRVLDPANGWNQVGDDIFLLGESEYGFTSFFVSEGYITTYEAWNSGYYRRYRLSDGFFEEEYLPFINSLQLYAFTYDWINNYLYCGLFLPNNVPYDFGFLKFAGTYKEATGTLLSPEIGPAGKWNDLVYSLETTNSLGYFNNYLLGKNKITQAWDTLSTNIISITDLSNISARDYPFLKIKFVLVDSTLGQSEPMKFKSLQVNYDYLPEINLRPDQIDFDSDTLLQGFSVEMSLKVDNIGYTKADSVRLDFYNNVIDSAFYSAYVNIPNDSSVSINKIINTNNLLYSAPISPIDVKVIATYPNLEYFTFNNTATRSFYVARDSIKPAFNITFDGREILNGDIVSSEPEVVITLEDNSPLPLDSTFFTLVHTYKNIPQVLKVPGPDLTYEYTPYPNSRAVITWKPKLADGKHTLEVLAKDASGNFFDSTSSRNIFNVFSNPDLLQVYNYPNPFSDNTYFTFELRGALPPEEFKIKIFTVAGRLIREIIPSTPLQIGFNKIFWDGKDEDGDEVANGLYFYKIISKHNGEVKTTLQKLAKVK